MRKISTFLKPFRLFMITAGIINLFESFNNNTNYGTYQREWIFEVVKYLAERNSPGYKLPC